MGPVRQNPIQRTVSLFICVCIALCTIVAYNIAQNIPDSFPSYPQDNHHCSDDVYLREGGMKHLKADMACTSTVQTLYWCRDHAVAGEPFKKKCLKDATVPEYPVNVYYCYEESKGECCLEDEQYTCCEPHESILVYAHCNSFISPYSEHADVRTHGPLCIGYNTVWSVLSECDEHIYTPDSVVTYLFHDNSQIAIDTQVYYCANFQ